jgi:hypothetical protein
MTKLWMVFTSVPTADIEAITRTPTRADDDTWCLLCDTDLSAKGTPVHKGRLRIMFETTVIVGMRQMLLGTNPTTDGVALTEEVIR